VYQRDSQPIPLPIHSWRSP